MTEVATNPNSENRRCRVSIFCAWAWILFGLFNQPVVLAGSSADEKQPLLSDAFPDRSAVASIVDVRLGLERSWKLGTPTHTQITIAGGAKGLIGRLEMETVDADGVGVIFQTECQIEQYKLATYAMISQHGRATRPISVRLLDAEGVLIAERSISDEERGKALPVSQPWIVGIGSGMNLGQAALQSAKGALPSYSSCEVADASRLPVVAKGYRGIDLLVISTRDWEILKGLSAEQQAAILDWVQEGGNALVWLGENAERVHDFPWLAKLICGRVEGLARSVEPMMLESFLSSQKRVGKLTCSRVLTERQCIVDLSLQAMDRQKLPFIYRSVLGFGRIQVCTSSLDAEPLRDWSERGLLLERLYNEPLGSTRETNSRPIVQANYLGYSDLSGQAHAVLDHFEDVRIGSLSLMAMILIGVIALLGPFDYFVIAKAWRRPAWTWLSLVLWSFSTLIGITLLARAWKPRGLAVNSIELIDIDYSTSRMRGRGLAHHYSGQAGRFDFSAMARSILPIPANDSVARTGGQTTSGANPTMHADLLWSGQPGYGLGGFDSDVRTDIGFPTYRVLDELPSKETQSSDPTTFGHGTKLVDVGITFAGSKAVSAEWTVPLDFATDGSQFSVAGNSEFLQGAWTNPMNEDLLDGWLLYRSWLYPLPSRIRPNGIAQIAASDIPKDLGRRLQRRQVVQDRDSSIPWDPTDRSDIGRLVEMLTLYQAAGGYGYTGLSHGYWGELDLSRHLKMNRVIVFGRLAQPVVDWLAKGNSDSLDVRDGRRAAYVRFVIPVTVAN